MKNDYSWVADKKREAMAAKLQRRGMPNMFPRTVAERYGVSYTGMGDDGRLDRSAPAGLDTSTNPPHIYHEGETRVATPEGAVYLNADVTSMADPGAMERMRAMEGTLPGFASGGGMLRGVPVSGMGGMPAAPQYRPADTPRAMGRGMLGMGAIGQPQQQQGNQGAAQTQPVIRGWNGNPASMANSGLATITQGAQPQPQSVQVPQGGAVNPLAGLRMGGNPQIPAQPQPMETLPGYASGGGQVQVIGDDGGVNPQYSGSNSNGANPTGSQPASASTGSTGAGGFFKPANTAINTARQGFGAATDFLKQSGAQAAMNGNNATVNPILAKRADQNNGLGVDGSAPPVETMGNAEQSSVPAPGTQNLRKEPGQGNGTTTPRELTPADLRNQVSYVNNAITGRAGQRAVIRQTPQELVTSLRSQGWSDDQIKTIFTSAGRSKLLSSIDWTDSQAGQANGVTSLSRPWTSVVQGVQNQVGQAVTGLRQGLENYSGNSSEEPELGTGTATNPATIFMPEELGGAAMSPENARSQGYIDQSNTPLSSSEFMRNPYAERRIDDMRQEDASRQAYLQHQHAMNGTDANAAWAQSAMERAQAEEDITNFASAAASQNLDKMMAQANEWLKSGDPAMVAEAARILNTFMPGSGIDFTGKITEANAGQFADALAAGATFALEGASEDDMYMWYKNMYGNLFDDATLKYFAKQSTMTVSEAGLRSMMNTTAYQNADADTQEYMRLLYPMDNDFPEGSTEMAYNVVDGNNNIVGVYSTREEAKANTPEGGTVVAGLRFTENAVSEASGNTEGETYKSGVDDPLLDDSALAIIKGDPSSQEFKHVIDDIARSFGNGKHSAKDLMNMPPAERKIVLDALAAGGNVVTSLSSARAQNKKDGRIYISAWGGSWGQVPQGPVLYNGRYAYITQARDANPGFSTTHYDIVFLDDGGPEGNLPRSAVVEADKPQQPVYTW